ncbi:MAG: tRNA (adenosine(37)-N6)-dimethylallyltransferase MiaA [Paludibacteraceae bacterium]|nr:tRNA (adenosine(37)-N6)-dimethylallyltransferase MiaA [Paludibacteraceae bacterium]
MIVIIGATGVGKTARAIEVAKQYGCPVVSADSRQIYRDLPIGTAAPTAQEQAGIPHYFVGCKELDEVYSAGQYARDCHALLQDLFTKHETVVMVGGSMMYVDAVCHGMDDIPEVPAAIREEVRMEYQQKGIEWLQQEVQRLDPVYWQQVDQHNPQRLMHCIEVSRASGQPYSCFRKREKHADNHPLPFDVQYIMVERPREELYERINLRVEQMVEQGLLQEAQVAFQKLHIPLDGNIELDYSTLPNSVNTVGYKELLRYFRGEWTLQHAIEMIQQNSRHYAKRQLTWWRKSLANE